MVASRLAGNHGRRVSIRRRVTEWHGVSTTMPEIIMEFECRGPGRPAKKQFLLANRVFSTSMLTTPRLAQQTAWCEWWEKRNQTSTILLVAGSAGLVSL